MGCCNVPGPEGTKFIAAPASLVGETQRSIGDLSAKTDRLISDVRSQGEKIDASGLGMSWMAGGAAVVGFLFAAGLGLVKLLPLSSGH